MKNLISVLVLSMATLICYSQEPDKNENPIELEDILITSKNAAYLSSVQDESTPKEVAKLQLKAANYDVKKHSEFSDEVETDAFEMAFRNSKGAIHAFYNSNGFIEFAYERFNDIILPRDILIDLLDSNRDWTMVGNLYISSYDKNNNNITRSYKIDLQRGTNTKTVKIIPIE